MKFASIGDICVDVYKDKKILGGTAYNSAVAAKKYISEVSIVSAIGNDKNGDLYTEAFKKNNIDSSHVEITNKPTSFVEVNLDESHSPIFGDWELGALDKWNLSESDLNFIQKYDIAKMTCFKPIEKQFSIFCKKNMPKTIKAGDFDGGSQYSFTPKELAKYADRLDVIIKSLDSKNIKDINFLQNLAKEKQKIILVTLGSEGSICFEESKQYIQKVKKINFTNTTGFGDIFIAKFLVEYVKTENIQLALKEASLTIENLPQS